MKGFVSLVGAGPGDPDLITVKALKAIQTADVIVYDRLSAPELLEHAKPDSQHIYVGKAKGCKQMSQKDINRLLVTLAQQPRRIVRLKGGDPFVFGRGGEEMMSLREASIEYEVIPGITAASGCAASCGIPLTHREVARAVTLLTAHGSDGKLPEQWHALVRHDHTLVIYMGLSKLATITQTLVQQGQSPDMPIAVISQGSTPQQQTVIGTLNNVAQRVSDAELPSPALIMIGESVLFAEHLEQVSSECTHQVA
ncbi:uroporphyrinogen-III C-methyltransferase [Echinimonas agarilytica]|uniref:uroporphyrinogen-III C-methyltransferase n=1 Tax=Echinimonas agarilytica TaxID=1215918 RepID=A0AA41W5B1_9GAMM|nr:uroporphyrinogen-III C-methyltransferase [Echinimonas agarilytica]MCM2678920.1 uroporphyrinogen-III C-methyltransferase [Echinimonas agarilytica]